MDHLNNPVHACIERLLIAGTESHRAKWSSIGGDGGEGCFSTIIEAPGARYEVNVRPAKFGSLTITAVLLDTKLGGYRNNVLVTTSGPELSTAIWQQRKDRNQMAESFCAALHSFVDPG